MVFMQIWTNSTLYVLTRVKGPLSLEKQFNMVYDISYSCGKVCVGETTRRDWRLGLRNIGVHA